MPLYISYRRDIDGLRAVAVLSVVAFHAFPSLVPGGYVGVDIFFVISGFLISTIVFRELEAGQFRLTHFYARRIRRIFPALSAVLAFCIVFGWFALLPVEYAQLGRHVAGGAAFLSNFVLWGEAGYFDATAEYKPLLHLWSLGIEEQFYIVCPPLLALAWYLRLRMAVVLLLVLLASFILNVARIDEHAVSTFYMPMTRAWELLVGAVLAYVSLHAPPLSMPLAGLSTFGAAARALLGALLIVIAICFLHSTSRFPGWWALLPTVGAVLVISAGECAPMNRLLLGNRVMVFIGLISYPLYLWHWPLLSFARVMEAGTPAAWIRAAAVMLSFLLAWLTYRFIEQPVRARKGALAVCGLVTTVAMVGVAGYSLNLLGGLPGRVPTQVALLKEFDWTSAQQNASSCLQRFAVRGMLYCLQTNPGAPPTIALIGDSHANQYFFALSNLYRAGGENLVNLGGGGCVPFLDLESSEKGTTTLCADVMREVLNYVVDSPSIHTVILASRGPLYTTGRGFGEIEHGHNRYIRDRLDPANTNYPAIFAASMDRTLSRLHSAGKDVAFVLDVPELGFDPRSCVNLRPLTLTAGPRDPCAVPRAVVDERNRAYRELALAVIAKHPGTKVFDPSTSLCDRDYCWARMHSEMLYRNDDHLSQKGAEFVVKEWP